LFTPNGVLVPSDFWTYLSLLLFLICVHIKLDSYILTNLVRYRHHFASHGGVCKEVGSHCPKHFYHRANFIMYANAITNDKMWSKNTFWWIYSSIIELKSNWKRSTKISKRQFHILNQEFPQEGYLEPNEFMVVCVPIFQTCCIECTPPSFFSSFLEIKTSVNSPSQFISSILYFLFST
jgi:hypothetical protein